MITRPTVRSVNGLVATDHHLATAAGLGIYLGLASAVVLIGFGLTIVIKKVPRPYATPEDDDL